MSVGTALVLVAFVPGAILSAILGFYGMMTLGPSIWLFALLGESVLLIVASDVTLDLQK
ncbi:hypothetical protein [Bradyrhizobium guangzhouense]|uniref:hypothetical protein n=1 Tax=Bradyrhizobium guangzhouense TaxID=1325095 RepID=UPI0013E8DA57|nr:hypothetical protein [Bradyrhizobium guangzhouense]